MRRITTLPGSQPSICQNTLITVGPQLSAQNKPPGPTLCRLPIHPHCFLHVRRLYHCHSNMRTTAALIYGSNATPSAPSVTVLANAFGTTPVAPPIAIWLRTRADKLRQAPSSRFARLCPDHRERLTPLRSTHSRAGRPSAVHPSLIKAIRAETIVLVYISMLWPKEAVYQLGLASEHPDAPPKGVGEWLRMDTDPGWAPSITGPVVVDIQSTTSDVDPAVLCPDEESTPLPRTDQFGLGHELGVRSKSAASEDLPLGGRNIRHYTTSQQFNPVPSFSTAMLTRSSTASCSIDSSWSQR